MNFNIIRKSDGTKNFPNNANTHLILTTVIDGINSIVSNLGRLSLPCHTTYEPDAMFRVRLEGVYFHDDDAAWNYGVAVNHQCDPYWYNNFGVNKRKEFNIFILGHDGGGCGPSPFYFNFRGSENPGTDPNTNWAMTQICAHELGHCFGLWHTYQPDPIPDTPTDLSVGWYPSNSTTTSNNIMSGNTDRNHLSKMQIEVLQGNLRSVASSLRVMELAPPTPKGLISDSGDGLLAVERSGDLLHAFWTPDAGQGLPDRWNLETVPNPDFRVVPGSLIPTYSNTAGLAYGVTDRYEVIKTQLVSNASLNSLGSLTATSIGGPGVTPGSLVDGRAGDLYGVDLNRRLVRIMASNGTSTVVTSPPMNAGSLISTEWGTTKRIFGVTESYALVHANSGSTAVTATNIILVPGSLVDAGSLGLFGVTPANELIGIDTTMTPTTYNITSLVTDGLHGASLVWQSMTSELFGVTPGGQVVRLVTNGFFTPTVLPSFIEVVPGSLVDGLANGLFGVSPLGDIVRIYPGQTPMVPWLMDVIAQWAGQVLPGSLISAAVDNGRAYGINVAGQIVGTWDDAGTIKYSIVE